MKPAEKVALLTALMEATKSELELAKAQALTLAEQVGVKSFATPFGSLTVANKAEAPMVTDPTMLLEWVRDAYRTEVEVITRVRPAFVTALLARVEWDVDTGQFIDPDMGEAVPGLGWSAAGDPYITWPSGDKQKETKTEAREWFHNRADELLSGLIGPGRAPHAVESKDPAA